MTEKRNQVSEWINENKYFIIPVILTIICVILIINFTYSTGWNNGYSEKVIGVRTPMVQSLGNCEIIYVRKLVKTEYSVVRGLFNCADQNEGVRTHKRVLFARTLAIGELYGFKGSGYSYDCQTGAIKVIWPYPLNEALFFEFNISQAKKFCNLDEAFKTGIVQIGHCEDCINETFYGFNDLEENLNVTDA